MTDLQAAIKEWEDFWIWAKDDAPEHEQTVVEAARRVANPDFGFRWCLEHQASAHSDMPADIGGGPTCLSWELWEETGSPPADTTCRIVAALGLEDE